jgi:NADH:ubiquinone oxidoreductase subunit E
MPEEKTADVPAIINRYGGDPGMLIPMMQDVQAACGYLPQGELKVLSGGLAVPLARIYSVASFYSSFRLMPKGDHTIQLCMGTVCFLKGAGKISAAIQKEFQLTPGSTSPDGKFTYSPVNCVGACALAPVMVVDGQYYGGLAVDSAMELLHKIASGEKPEETPAAVEQPAAASAIGQSKKTPSSRPSSKGKKGREDHGSKKK